MCVCVCVCVLCVGSYRLELCGKERIPDTTQGNCSTGMRCHSYTSVLYITPFPCVQTLFNPNKTVVKIFIVNFDLSDMPSSTQTFIRHKTLSSPAHTTARPSQSTAPSQLHYLIHLWFHSSRSGHIYLTKNIKLIFAGRAPDTMDFDPSQVHVYTVSEGPTKPKYCPL